MDITYTKCGDYYIPNIVFSDTTHYHIGKYGRMRRTFLQEHRPIQYSDLVLTEKLFPPPDGDRRNLPSTAGRHDPGHG
ncbi:MAG: TnpV protein [Clostridiales bacterium]|nr:TnpV protein [Clostridiales bacterium]